MTNLAFKYTQEKTKQERRQEKLLSTLNYLNSTKMKYNQTDILNLLNTHLHKDCLKEIKLNTLRSDLSFLKKVGCIDGIFVSLGQFKGSKIYYRVFKNSFELLRNYFNNLDGIKETLFEVIEKEFDRNSTGIRQEFDNSSSKKENISKNVKENVGKNISKNMTLLINNNKQNKLEINNNKEKEKEIELSHENKNNIKKIDNLIKISLKEKQSNLKTRNYQEKMRRIELYKQVEVKKESLEELAERKARERMEFENYARN